jgi:hypothetical protein
LIQVKAAGAYFRRVFIVRWHKDAADFDYSHAAGSAGLLLVACRPRVLFGRHHSIAFRVINRDSAAQAHAIRPISPNKSGHGAMGTYLLFVMVAFVIIYLFYAVIHPERF